MAQAGGFTGKSSLDPLRDPSAPIPELTVGCQKSFGTSYPDASYAGAVTGSIWISTADDAKPIACKPTTIADGQKLYIYINVPGKSTPEDACVLVAK